MEHKVEYRRGTDARNHTVQCSCGWKASDTYKGVRARGDYHVKQDNPLDWHDPKRAHQPDKQYPPYKVYLHQ